MQEQTPSAIRVGSKLVVQYVQLIKRLSALLLAEARLAKQSIVPLFITLLCCLLLFATSWLCLTAFIIVLCWHFTSSLPLSFMIGLLINLTILYLAYLFFVQPYRDNLTFPITRKLLKQHRTTKNHEKPTTKE